MTDLSKRASAVGEARPHLTGELDPFAAAARACLEAANAASCYAAARLCAAADGHDAGEWSISAARVLGACADVLGALSPSHLRPGDLTLCGTGDGSRIALARQLALAGVLAAEGTAARTVGESDDASAHCVATCATAAAALRLCLTDGGGDPATLAPTTIDRARRSN